MILKGYIVSHRLSSGGYVQQSLQSSVIRHYCLENGFGYELGSAEYYMYKRVLVLKSLVEKMVQRKSIYGGLVTYGIDFFLDNYESLRKQIEILIEHGLAFHLVLEGICVSDSSSLEGLDAIVWYKCATTLWEDFE
jgi:sporadic carbohydrate cluster protein (TIGR04323 family)